MKFLNIIAKKLKKTPKFKKYIKNMYQFAGFIFSDKKSSPETITSISNLSCEHLFGYYDKCPWNKKRDKMIYLRTKYAFRSPAPKIPAVIILKDLITNKEIEIGITYAWNVQQGAMLQWLGPDFDTRIIYNDFRDNRFCSIILNIFTKEEKVINSAIYSVSTRGDFAISLDFDRLNRLRPGYGYSNLSNNEETIKIPDTYCMWKIDLESNDKQGLLNYSDLVDLEVNSMAEAYHKVNHIMINPDNSMFIFLHRWINNGVKEDRLYSMDINGKNKSLLMDDGMVSHSTWKNNEVILTYARDKILGDNFYFVNITTKLKEKMGDFFKDKDGHPSFSPDGKQIVIDSYPSFRRKQSIFIVNTLDFSVKKIASIYSNFKYRGDTRCDLHPRWNWNSKEICFDGSQKKLRNIYSIKVEEE